MHALPPYWKRDPYAWRAGTRGLSFELKGVYGEVIDQMHIQEGPAHLNLTQMAREAGTNARALKRLLGELLSLGKLQQDEHGRWHNKRADTEIRGKRLAAYKPTVRAKLSAKHGLKNANGFKSLGQTFDQTLQKNPTKTVIEEVHTRAITRSAQAGRAHGIDRYLPDSFVQAAADLPAADAAGANPAGPPSSIPVSEALLQTRLMKKWKGH